MTLLATSAATTKAAPNTRRRRRIAALLGVCVAIGFGSDDDALAAKETLIPQAIDRVPPANDFSDEESEFCHARSRESDNFAIFWAKEYGVDPLANPDPKRRFDVDHCLRECERFFDYYVQSLEWVDKQSSYAAKYKFLIIVFGGDDGTAYGGSVHAQDSAEDKVEIGALWTPAVRINRPPYGVLAHELGHSFQAILRADTGGGFRGGAIYEMTSQFMLWHVYPEWMTFENYHLVDFMRQTHLAFLHEANMYHSCYPLEYWSTKRGAPFIGKLWREAQEGEDPVLAYKRITSTNQAGFNDEMFDACRRFVTWDLPRIETVAARYANQHHTRLTSDAEGWYHIAAEKRPQAYGYNAVPLNVPVSGETIRLTFEGLTHRKADDSGKSGADDSAGGWRYGFVASLEEGQRVYSPMYAQQHGEFEFKPPADARNLWLVVMGAPEEHRVLPRRRRRTAPGEPEAEFPYRFRLVGSTPLATAFE
ncbi:MAG: hypothetical protein KDA61_10470 [Planctomycetales bacterium]|nr:hypothetical protein [Planctomycetales bacterium]